MPNDIIMDEQRTNRLYTDENKSSSVAGKPDYTMGDQLSAVSK